MTSEQERVLHEAGIDRADPMYLVIASIYDAVQRCDGVGLAMQDIAERLDRRERRTASIGASAGWWQRWNITLTVTSCAACMLIGVAVGYRSGHDPSIGAKLAAWESACAAPDAVVTVDGRRQCRVWLDAKE